MLQIVLVVAYMVLTHLAVALRQDGLALVAVYLLLVIPSVGALRRGARWPWPVLALGAGVLWLLSSGPWSRVVLFLPPVVVNVAFAWFFGHTLVANRVPLIERFIRAMHEPGEHFEQDVLSYARNVTRYWTAMFCINAIVCLLLAVLAQPGGLLTMLGLSSPFHVPTIVWTLYADIGCYGVTGMMFAVEYQIRKRRFPWQPYANFFAFLRDVIAVSPAVIGSVAYPAREGGRG